MNFFKLPIYALAAALMTAPTLANAWWWDWDDDDDDEVEIPFEEFILFNELNNTDGDLGIHFLLDGGPWKRFEIEGPNERTLIKVRARGPLRRQGGTEIFFESAEPTFDEQSPAEFFARFPEGIYEAEGIGLEGEELESEDYYSHTMPAPPGGVTVTGSDDVSITPDLEGDCAIKGGDEEVPVLSVMGPPMLSSAPVVISWDQVETSHLTIGNTGEAVEIEIYELVVEDDEGDAVLSIKIPGDEDAESYSLAIPNDYIGITDVWKFEIIAIAADTGNATAVESCFGVL